MSVMEHARTREVVRPKRREAARRDAVINIRVATECRDLFDRAAAVAGKTRTEVILEGARKHAIDLLLDQRLFSLSGKHYEDFLRVLDQASEPSARLKQLLASKPPWEK